MAGFLYKLAGIIGNTFKIGKSGPLLKNNSGVVEARNAADSAYAIVRGGTPSAGNDLTTKDYVDTICVETWERVAIDTINVSSSATHTGSAVDMSTYVGGMFDLEITSITAPDTEDAWEIKIQGRTSSSDDWIDLAYWVDYLNAGDNTTTSGDPNRGRFDSGVSAGQHFRVDIPQLMSSDIRIIATAYDQNSDGDMALQATILAYLRER